MMKTCSNCRHYDSPIFSGPCASCDMDGPDYWTAADKPATPTNYAPDRAPFQWSPPEYLGNIAPCRATL